MTHYQKIIQEQVYCRESISTSLRQDFSELITNNVAYKVHIRFMFQIIPIIDNSLVISIQGRTNVRQ